MTHTSELRPAVISRRAVDTLEELLAFRHYLIHGSVVVSPDGERLVGVRTRVLEAAVLLGSDLDDFDRHVATLIAAREA